MAGARALWVANGMKREQFGKPIIAIVNSFTQFVPGHTHLHEIGQIVKKEIEAMGCYAAEFNTIAVDDGIAMGHDGMLYSLPSRDVIADSVEYMVNAHKADAMICISNCDKVTPGMLMASMRLNIPTVFVSGGPMESHKLNGENADLITAMIKGGDKTVSDEELANILDTPIFHLIGQTADELGVECYVVGGYVRDIFLDDDTLSNVRFNNLRDNIQYN